MMQRSRWFCWVAIPCLIVPSVLSAHLSAAAVPPELPSQPASQHVTATMMRMPLQFEANHGQVDAQVKFLARGKGYTLFLTPTESVMVLQQRETTTEMNPRAKTDPATLPEPAPIKQAAVRMKLEGANRNPAIDGMEKLPGIVNYFIGNDPKKWRTEIPTYAKVQYQEAYPGIDLAYYGNQGKLEYDFIVAPGADPNQIKLAFEGTSEIRVADSGDLLITTELGDLRMQQPIVYQLEPDGHKTLVAGQYVIRPTSVSLHASRTTNHKVEIQLASYDHKKPVVIDPVLSWATYLGSAGSELSNGIAVDNAGQAYVTGVTLSTDFPLASPFQTTSAGGHDAFITKLSAGGASLVYSTYLGGNNIDQPLGLAVDNSGQAYVTGYTQSTNFPTASPFQATFAGVADAFVTKLSAGGTSLLYSTHLGGTDFDNASGIAVDNAGQAYVTGATVSANFPLVGSFQPTFAGVADAFVTKLSAEGVSLIYSTYLGGAASDSGIGIAVDNAGQAYVTGHTLSTDFPTDNAFQASCGGAGGDAFVTKFSTAGAGLVYSTCLGGSVFDVGRRIAVDNTGQAYVTGTTESFDFPTASPFQSSYRLNTDVFVAKLSTTGASLVYSTYLGGTLHDFSEGIAVDSTGQAYVTGVTWSTDFPLANPSQATFGGNTDVFVAKLSAGGASLVYSTYLGGNDSEQAFGIAVDSSGQAYVTGYTTSANFPTVIPFQATLAGEYDVFVAKISDVPPNQNPVCSAAVANPNSLWQPDGRMVPIAIAGLTDPDGDSVTLTVTTVTQDEPIITKGAKKLSPDAVIQAGSVSVRAERLDTGNGRVYQISFRADDGKGGFCIGSVKVGVPLNLKKGLIPIDDGQIYSSTTP